MSDQYIPDLTERYPSDREIEPTIEAIIDTRQVWQNMKTDRLVKIDEIHEHYILTEDGEQIDLDDLKNKWVLIG